MYRMGRNPVRAAYMSSLESQISSLRDELATVYKTQGQNAQRLLSMNETLREKEELSRVDTENLRKTREELATIRRKVDQHAELMAEKDRTVQVILLQTQRSFVYQPHNLVVHHQILHDEISTLQLELGQIEDRNATLNKDNAKLLQRWLDAKQTEATKMNEANEFYENMRSRHNAVLSWRDGGSGGEGGAPNNGADTASQASTSMSGNGEANEDRQSTSRKDGTPSPAVKVVDLTPNG